MQYQFEQVNSALSGQMAGSAYLYRLIPIPGPLLLNWMGDRLGLGLPMCRIH